MSAPTGIAAMTTHEKRLAQLREPIDAAPFIAWVEARLRAIEREQAGALRLAGAAAEVNYAEQLATELGWDGASGTRRLYRWRHENSSGLVERAVVEDALHHAGVGMWEVYGDLDAEHRGLTDGYCSECRRDVSTTDGACPWCDAPVLDARPKHSHPRIGQGRLMTDEQVRAAHVIYERRSLYLRDVAELLWRQYGYANRESCEVGLRNAFAVLGLPRMTKGEASRRAHTTHGLTVGGRVTPAYTRLIYERAQASRGICGQPRYDGTPCQYTCEPGTSTCGYHNPDKLAVRRANLATARRVQRELEDERAAA